MTSGSMVQNVAYFNCPCIHHLSPNICNICYGITFCSIVNESNFQKQQVIFCSSILRWNNILYHRIMYLPLWLAEPCSMILYFLCGRIHIRYISWVFEMKIGVKWTHFNITIAPRRRASIFEERTTTLHRRLKRSTDRLPASAYLLKVCDWFRFFRFIYRWTYQNNLYSQCLQDILKSILHR